MWCAMSNNAIVLRSLSKSFNGGRAVLDNLDLAIEQGERVSLVGPSGCGKSTLISIISGLSEQTSGTVEVAGATTARERLSHCAWMPQRDLLFPWMSVVDNVSLSLRNQGVKKKDAREQAIPLLERFGLGEFSDKAPFEMSGGMRQRASFIRTMLTGKDVLLFDEPFGALDSITRSDLQSWLHGVLLTLPKTTVLVTHDVEEALILSDRVIVMSGQGGQVIEDIPGFFELSHDDDVRAQADFVSAREKILHSLSLVH